MLVLFDQSTPVPIRPFLKGHTVETASQRGWDKLKNGELLKAAEDAGFDVLVAPDKNIRYQQNLTARTIALVVLGNPQWPILRLHVDSVVTAVNAARPAVTRKSKYRNNDTGTAALFLVRLSQHSTFVPVPHQRTDSYWRFTGVSFKKTPIGGNSGTVSWLESRSRSAVARTSLSQAIGSIAFLSIPSKKAFSPRMKLASLALYSSSRDTLLQSTQ